MNKYFVEVSCGFGTTNTSIIEAIDLEEAEVYALQESIDNASMFGYEQDEDYFSDRESVGRGWDEELGGYEDTQAIDYYVCEYSPKEHDHLL